MEGSTLTDEWGERELLGKGMVDWIELVVEDVEEALE